MLVGIPHHLLVGIPGLGRGTEGNQEWEMLKTSRRFLDPQYGKIMQPANTSYILSYLTLLVLVKVKDTVFAWEKWFVTQHLSENATHRPDVNSLAVAFRIQHNLRGSVPPSGDIFC